VTAPGFGVVGARSSHVFPSPQWLMYGDSTHRIHWGTSAAAAHAAGAAALYLEMDPTLTPSELRAHLAATALADNFTGTTPNDAWGHGKLRLAPLETDPDPPTACETAGGYAHSLWLRGTGSDAVVLAWGGNAHGQVGDGTTTSRQSPVHVLSGAVAVAAGAFHSAAVKPDGTVWTWGPGTSTASRARQTGACGAGGAMTRASSAMERRRTGCCRCR
jgi:hypothetical protein